MKKKIKPNITLIYDDEDGSHTKGSYWLKVKFPGMKNIDDFFTEEEIKEVEKYIDMPGISGHIPLHNWLKDNHPGFFKKAISNGDPNGIVNEFLEKLQEKLNKK